MPHRVRLTPADFTGRMSQFTPEGFEAQGVTLSTLIQRAYGLEEIQIEGGSSWIRSERYHVLAKSDDPVRSKQRNENRLQALLAERFQLKFRLEEKRSPVYVLTVSK